MRFYDINNAEELRSNLISILKTLDRQHNNFQTDIYLYLDSNGNGKLDTFVNIGGRSWLNDDHLLLGSDYPHYEDSPAETDEEWDDILSEYQWWYEDAADEMIHSFDEGQRWMEEMTTAG